LKQAGEFLPTQVQVTASAVSALLAVPDLIATSRRPSVADRRRYDAPLPACVWAGPISLAGPSDLASTASIVALAHFLSHDRTHTVVTGGIAESVKEALLAPTRG
jgi:hypothetical protein